MNDIYKLLEDTRAEFRQSLAEIKGDVADLTVTRWPHINKLYTICGDPWTYLNYFNNP